MVNSYGASASLPRLAASWNSSTDAIVPSSVTSIVTVRSLPGSIVAPSVGLVIVTTGASLGTW